MHGIDKSLACILTLHTHIYIYIYVHIAQRLSLGLFYTLIYICVHVHVAERLSLSCTLGATTRWHSLCTCTYIYIFTDIYLYINMHVLFWLKSSRLKLKEVDRRAPTIPVSFIHATQAEAVGLVARTTGAA